MAPRAEEAALRAKIQAMKNLLEAKKSGQGAHAPPGAGYSRGGASHHQGWAANRSWSAPPAAAYYHTSAGSASANKVWRREGAASSGSASLSTSGSGARPPARVAKPKPWKQSVRTLLWIEALRCVCCGVEGLPERESCHCATRSSRSTPRPPRGPCLSSMCARCSLLSVNRSTPSLLTVSLDK
jgi:hypothetical protein